MKNSKRILEIIVRRMPDEVPDTSMLGKYSDKAETDYAIDRGPERERNTFRYFNGPVQNYLGCTPEEIRKYVAQDFERAEGLNRGDWFYQGIRAEAIIELGSGITQRIHSGALWGIESDSDKSYIAEVSAEELASLKTELVALGFSRRSISTAFKSVQERQD